MSFYTLPSGGALIANADGDIVGEIIGGNGGDLHLRATGVDAHGNTVQISNHISSTGVVLTEAQFAETQTQQVLSDLSQGIGLFNALSNIQNWEALPDVGRLSALVGLYNAADGLGAVFGGSGDNLPGSLGTAAGVLSLVQGVQSGDALLIANGLNNVANQVVDRSLDQAFGSSGVPYVGIALALSNLEDDPVQSVGTLVGMAIAGPLGGAVGGFIGGALGGLLGGGPPPPPAGHVVYGWDDAGQITQTLNFEQSNGGAAAAHIAASVLALLEGAVQSINSQTHDAAQHVALNPYRMPSVHFADGHTWLYSEQADGNSTCLELNDPNLAQALVQALGSNGGLLPEWQVRTLQTHLQTLHASGASAEDIAAERDAAIAEAMQAGSDAQAGTLVYALQGNAAESADFRTQSFGALVIHLEGSVQALQTTVQVAVDAVQTTHVLRNTDSDDYLEQTQWVSATDANGNLQGMLVLDFNGNGQIETRDILNLGGNRVQAGNPTTEAALATQNAALQRNNTNWLDANGDGVLDAHDPAFAAIRLWVDLQSNGLVELGEMQGLADTGVTSINLRTGQVAYSGTDAQGNVVDGFASMLATTLSSNTSGVRWTHIMQVNADGSLDALNAGAVLEHEGYQGQVHTVDSGTGGGWGGVRQQTYTHEALRTGDWEGTADQDVHRHGGGNVASAPTETRATSASDFGPVRTQANPTSHSTVTDSDTRVVSDAPMQAPQVRPQSQVIVNSGDSTIRSNPPTSGRLVGGATSTAMRPTDGRIAFVPTTPSSVRGEILAVTAGMIESSNSPFFGSGTHAGLGVLTAVGLGAVQTVQAAEPHSTQARDTAPDDVQAPIGTDVHDTPNAMPNGGGSNAGAAPVMFRQVDLGPLNALSAPPATVPDIARPTTSVPSASNVVGSASNETPSFYATLVASTPLQIPTVPVFRADAPTEIDGVALGNPSVRIDTLHGAEDGVLRWTPAVLLAQASTPNASAVPSQPALTITSVSHPLNGHVSLVNGEVWFAPAPNFHGTASFSYTVTDQYGMSASCRVTLQVDAVNDAPIASGERGAGSEDTGVIFTPAQLLANDLDDDIATDSQVLCISRVGQAQNGTVWLDTQGNLRFEPSANYHGSAQFTYWVSDGLATDGAGAETPATVMLTIFATNDIPIANSEVVNSSEDRTLRIDPAHLLANDSDADMTTDGQVLHIAAVGNATHGSVTFADQPDGSQHVLFTPDTDYFGVASFQYTVSDGAGGTAVGTVVVNVAQVNDAPVATNDTLVNTEEDTALHISLARLLGNDTDADSANAQWGSVSDVLVVVAVGNAVHGTVALVDLADGTQEAVFTPEADYHGPASFIYQVRDGSGAVAQAWATFEVTAVNDVPVAVGETIDSSEDTPLLISPAALLQNDSDVDTATDGQVTRVIAVSNAQHGTATLNANGTISFVPDRNFFGAASFDYTVDDGNGGQATATATIALANVNDAPLATGETIQGIEDEALTIQATALLHNDSDVDSPSTDLAISRVQSGTGGTAALNAGGNVVFTPEANYNGTATFTYWVRDSAGQESSQVTATVLLSAVNDAPSAQGEIIAGASEDAMFRISAALLLANDNDADDPGSALRLSWVGHATGGTVSLDSNGNVVFIPHANFHGNATFSYRARDAAGLESATVQAVVPVASVNDNPVGVDDQFQTYNNATMTIGFGQLTGNDRDADGDALSIAAVRNNAHGHVQIVNGQVQFVPTAGFTGTAAFDYLADDGHGGQAWATAYVGVREAPNRYPTVDISDVSIHWFNPQYVEVLSMTIYFNINDDGNTGATRLQLVSAVERNGGWWPDATSLTTYDLSGGSGQIQVLGPVVFGTEESGVRTYFNDYRSTWVLTDGRGLQNTWHFDFYDYGINSWSYRGYADHYGYYYPPLVMDLNGDGVHFASIDQSNVAFDVNADGTDDRMAWAGRDDGVLVWDRDQNHRITDASEFGFQTLRPGAQTDLEGLQALDTNANGLLDAGDTSFSEFAVWQDANGNGTTEVGEFNTLVELGITSISLVSDGQLRDAGSVLADSVSGEADVVVMGNAAFTRADGTTGLVADTLLAFEPGRASPQIVGNSMVDLQVAEVIRQALLFNQACNAAVPAESEALGFIPIAPDVQQHDALVTSQDGCHPLHQPA